MNLGLASLIDPVIIDDIVVDETATFEDALEAGLEALNLIDSFEIDITILDEVVHGLESLERIQATIETNGVEQSLIELVGLELAYVAPSILDDEVDIETLKAELSVAHEGFFDKVIDTIKAIIAKIIAFVKNLFDKTPKLRAAIVNLKKVVSQGTVDEESLREKRVTGYNQILFKRAIAGHAKSEQVLDGMIKDLKSEAQSKEAANDAFFNRLSELGINLMDDPVREKKSIGQHGFKSSDIINLADPVLKILDMGKALERKVSSAQADAERDLKGGDKATKDAVLNNVKSIGQITSIITRNIIQYSMQEASMLKASAMSMKK
jgi:hypothetical protein